VSRREEQPKFIDPMLLMSGEPPKGDGWTYEVKWDGMRAQVRYDGRSLCVRSRPGRLCAEFPESNGIADPLGDRRTILDGELVVLRDDGRPDFALLRQRLGRRPRDARPVTFIIFDVLHLDDCATRHLPYLERRAVLEELALESPYWRTPASLHLDDPQALVRRVAALGLEGIVQSGSMPRTGPAAEARRG
jgi:bifunctional non-homologous end joining protein LigD